MVKKKIFIGLIITIILVFLNSTHAFAKVSHFRTFLDATSAAMTTIEPITNTPAGLINYQAAEYATKALQKLEFNNNYITDQPVLVNTAQEVLNYTNLLGNNYAVAIFGHGVQNVYNQILLNNSSSTLYSSDISGNWHLVLLNVCHIGGASTFANAFNTVGYSDRATIAFTGSLGMLNARNYWINFYNLACSDTLANINSYASSVSGASGVVYGDSSWNGYAWF